MRPLTRRSVHRVRWALLRHHVAHLIISRAHLLVGTQCVTKGGTMTTDGDLTPTERPLMRSDLDAVRKTLHRVLTWQEAIFEEQKRARYEPRVLTAICVVCTFVSIGCSLGLVLP